MTLLLVALVVLGLMIHSWVPIAAWIALWCLVLWTQAAPAAPRRRRR